MGGRDILIWVLAGLMVVNLALTGYVALRGPDTRLMLTFTSILGQKEAELILLRAVVQRAQQAPPPAPSPAPTPGKR